MRPVDVEHQRQEADMTEAERSEVEELWSTLGEGPAHPDATVEELQQVVFALID